MLVQDISYAQAIRSIREIVLDVGLVQAFKVSGQDLIFKKTLTEVTLGDTVKTIGEDGILKLYDLVALLVEKEVTVEILPDYVATEFVDGLINFDIATISDPNTGNVIKAKNYFTDSIIETVMIEFFSRYICYDGVVKTTQTIFDTLNYFQKRKLILWTAFYLVDRKRMQMASTSVLISQSNGGVSCGGTDFKNMEVSTTTRVGDVYTEMEKTVEDGKGLAGFTSLWGDKYSYLTKLQLYIRGKYEQLFNDFSLRDDAMISQSFTMEKTWENDAWLDTHGFSNDTYGIFVEVRD